MCALVLGFTASCATNRSTPAAGESGTTTAAAPLAAGSRMPRPSVEFAPALWAVREAVLAGDDAVARRGLAVVFARGPTGPDLELARSFADILDGRELARSLDLRLVARADAEAPTRTRVALHAEHDLPGGLRLEFAGAVLIVELDRTDVAGQFARATESDPAPAALRMTVPADGRLEIELGSFAIDTGPALAAREVWRLELTAGVAWTVDGRRLPLRTVEVTRAERQRIAAFLPDAPLDAAPLVEFLLAERSAGESEERWRARLMERAVRIPTDRREAALDALGDAIGELSDARIEEAQGALVWLARARNARTAQEWRRWFELRARRARAADGERLELPAAPTAGDR